MIDARTALTAAMLATGFALAGCASSPNVIANSDTSANFAGFKTFGFAPELGTDRGGNRTALSRYLIAAATRELTARGLTEAGGTPDLLVNFNTNVSDKVRIDNTPMPMAPMVGRRGYYGYRTGMYGTWGSYSQTTATQYTQGTLNIDVVDAARKQLVWEGVVTKTITQKSVENLEATIDSAVTSAFAKFPLPPR